MRVPPRLRANAAGTGGGERNPAPPGLRGTRVFDAYRDGAQGPPRIDDRSRPDQLPGNARSTIAAQSSPAGNVPNASRWGAASRLRQNAPAIGLAARSSTAA